MTTRLIRLPEVQNICGLSRTGVYQAMNRGEFPLSIKIRGERAAAWVSDEIDAWVQQRIAEARATT